MIRSLFGLQWDKHCLAGLPTLIDDETLYSWCGSVHSSCPSSSALETSRRLFGVPYAALMHDFPSHLEGLRSVLGDGHDFLDHLALRHTLLGYFLVAQPADACRRILDDCRHGAASSLKFRLGIAASRIGGYHPLKGCFRCFDAQEAHGFRAYWRVQHQAPLVMYCEKHSDLLSIAWDRTTPVHRRGWILPRSGLAKHWRQPAPPSSQALGCLERLASFSRSWSNMQPASLHPKRLAQTYRVGLRQLDLLSAGGSVRLSEAAQLINHHFRGIRDLDELRSLRDSESGWSNLIGNLSRVAPRPCHPAKHLLLATALFPTWPQFMEAYESSALQEQCPPTPTDLPSDSDSDHRKFAELVKDDGLSVSAAGRRIGVSATTAVRWAKILGLPYTSRAKIHTTDRLNEIRRRLVNGEAKSSISKELGISAITVDRVVSSEPAVASAWREARHEAARQTYRRHFAALVAAMHGSTIKQIREVPGSGYAWLYRHDRHWLLENLPFFQLSPSPV